MVAGSVIFSSSVVGLADTLLLQMMSVMPSINAGSLYEDRVLLLFLYIVVPKVG